MTIIYIPEERIGSPETLARLMDKLQGEPGVRMTAAARDETEGATERRERAEGKCQAAWRNYPHVNVRPDDPTVYRQHRCGREAGHRGSDRCRYCEQDRSSA
jgi:hypothetical protein